MGLGNQVIHILKSYVLKSFALAVAVLLIVMVIWLLRGYHKGAYWNAKRAKSGGDIKRSSELFKEAVKKDAKGTSFKAVLALMAMDERQGLSALIDLLDISTMNYVSVDARVMMCGVIRKRTSDTTGDKLPLDPYASQDIRAKQKRQWQEWFADAKGQYDWLEGRFVPRQTLNN